MNDNSAAGAPTALGDLRVIDLAGPSALYCTKMLADLGAHVIRIEPPNGDPLRRQGPFIDGIPDPERSIPALHYNTGKRSIVLDIEQPDGRAILRRLAAGADVLVESFRPGYLAGLGLSYADLRAQNPELIMASVTPFGQEGPYAGYEGSDLVGVAMGGLMALNGVRESPPFRPGGEQAYIQASLVACAGVLMALNGRYRHGQGEHVDISIQEAVALTTLQSANANYMTFLNRVPGRGAAAEFGHNGTFQCRDGRWVSFVIPPNRWDAVVEWLSTREAADDLGDERWREQRYRSQNYQHVAAVVRSFLGQMDAETAFHEAQQRGILVIPVNDVSDLLEDEQLQQRGFFTPVEDEALGRTLVYPGAPYHHAKTPWRIGRAPLPGEHTREVLEALGIGAEEIERLAAAGVVGREASRAQPGGTRG